MTSTIIGLLIIGLTAYLCYLCYLRNEGFAERTFGAAPNTPAVLCQAGFWCPTASGGTKAFPCPGGTYGATPGLTNPTCTGFCQAGCVCKDASTEECPAPCPPGYYCVKGTGGPTSPVICPQGFYCPASTVIPIACPPGKFCPLGTSSIA